MKKYFMIVAVALLATFSLNAQDTKREELKEKIDSEKTAFFTEKMNLTPAQAPKFWSLYNEFQSKDYNLNKKKGELRIKAKSEDLSDKEYDATIKELLKIERDKLELQEKFFEDIAKFLSAKQMFMYYEANNEFHANLLRKLRLPARAVMKKQ